MTIEPEFTRPIAFDRIAHGEVSQKIAADERERPRIAARLGLPEIASLVAEFTLHYDKQTGLTKVEGEASAAVTQTCVVSGDEFPVAIKATIRALFSDEAISDVDVEDTEWDDIEPVGDGIIDIGELAVQHLSLALDPYPRKPSAELPAEFGEKNKVSPFAVLQTLNKRNDDQ